MSASQCEYAAEIYKRFAHESQDWLEKLGYLETARDWYGLAEVMRHSEAVDRWEGEGGSF